jgi:hypothetical protein
MMLIPPRLLLELDLSTGEQVHELCDVVTTEERILLDHEDLFGETTDADFAHLDGPADAVGDEREATIAIQAEGENSDRTLLRIVLNGPRVDHGSAVHTEKILYITQDVLNIVRHLDNDPPC